MTLNFCAVTGTLVAPDGALMPDVQLQFLPAPVAVRGQSGDSLHPRPVSAVADADAAISVELAPGVYTVRTRDVGGREYQPYLIDVPQSPAAILADIMLHLPAPQTVYDAAASARVAAHAAADAGDGASLATAEAAAAATSAEAAAASADEAETLLDAAMTRSFASKAAAAATHVPAGVTRIVVEVDGHAITYRRLPGATALATADGGQWDYESGVLASSLTVTVPGDYPDIQTALQRTAGLRTLAGVTITVRQDVTHPITVPIALSGGDWSHYTIAMNPSLWSDPVGALQVAAGFPANTAILTLTRCRGPRIMASFDGAGIAERGIWLSEASIHWHGGAGFFIGNIAYPGGGAPNGCGIFANNNSDIYASGLIVRDCGFRNLHLTGGSRIKAHQSKWIDSGEFNIFISRGCIADLSAGVEVSGGTSGVVVRRSLAALDAITVSGCSEQGLASQNGSVVSARAATVTGCARGVSAFRGGRVDVTSATVTGSAPGDDLRVAFGGEISANDTTTSNAAGVPALEDTNVAGFNLNDSGGIIRSANHPADGEITTDTADRVYRRTADGWAYAEGSMTVDMTTTGAQALAYPGAGFIEPPSVWFSVMTPQGIPAPPHRSHEQVYGPTSAIRLRAMNTQWRIEKVDAGEGRLAEIPLRFFAMGRWR